MGEIYFQIGIVLFLVILGFTCGTIAERKHFRNLDNREKDNGDFLITQLKSFPNYASGVSAPQLIIAETVVATDYFKSFLANLRRLFGGEVRSFHSLLSRARREATQRVVEQARELGYNAICNLRIETADVGGNNTAKKKAAMVAIIATATAYNQQTY